ncbi:MAG: flagellar motor protein MotB [Candidatus Margulisbacteria bacterium]|nr:flagellar motor protein MotB [Candidatus Margulisiibacteriota bacterium]
MAKKKEPEKAPNHERWLLTYADLITLLLTFFIVLYALSMVDSKKFSALAESLRLTLGRGTPRVADMSGGLIMPGIGMPTERDVDQKEMESTMHDVASFIKDNEMGQDIQANFNKDGNMEIRLSDGILFGPGQANLKPESLPALRKIGEILADLSFNYVIEGHTDNLPIVHGLYASNWELSAARALAVEKFLVDYGKVKPYKVSIAGFGEYKPLVPNTSPENRAKNRRVAIIVVKKENNEL